MNQRAVGKTMLIVDEMGERGTEALEAMERESLSDVRDAGLRGLAAH